MDGEIDSFQKVEELLSKIDQMPKHRIDKCRSLHHLASITPSGIIVELGTYHGIGAIALYYGSCSGKNLGVFTVDDYVKKRGWAGEIYEFDDIRKAKGNFREANARVYQIIGDAESVGYAIGEVKIGLLFWDTGSYNVIKDTENWIDKIIPGGFFVIHDTADGRLVDESFYETMYLNHNFGEPDEMPGGIIVLEKKEE